MQQERRSSPRYDIRLDVDTYLETDGPSPTSDKNKGVDISYDGAYLQNKHPHRSPGKVRFVIENGGKAVAVERSCDILWGREWEQSGCAVRFHQPLTQHELAKLAAPIKAIATSTKESLELAFRDYSEVSQEIRAIEFRRSQIFFWTLAAIATWVMAAIGLVLSNKLKNVGFWTVVGASLPYMLLTLGILASIETARSVNLRRGFLAVLTNYIRQGTAPPNYLGWIHLHAARLECRARIASGLCLHRSSPCWDEWRKNPNGQDYKRAVPSILDNFTAFTAAVYAILYCVIVLILMYASLRSLSPWLLICVGTALIEGAFLVVVAVFLARELLSIRRGRHSTEAQSVGWDVAFSRCQPIHAGRS